MKKQKGFVVPLLIAIVAILTMGSVYVYQNKKIEPAVPVNVSVQDMNQTQTVNTEPHPGWITYKNIDNGFSIQYSQEKYLIDNKTKYGNTITLNPITETSHFYPKRVMLNFGVNDIECNRLVGFKKPDGQILAVGEIAFQHVSYDVKTQLNKLIDNYEFFDNYFYTKNNKCYFAVLHTFTSISKIDKTDISGNKVLSDADIQKQLKDVSNEVDMFKSDFKEIISTFKLY